MLENYKAFIPGNGKESKEHGRSRCTYIIPGMSSFLYIWQTVNLPYAGMILNFV